MNCSPWPLKKDTSQNSVKGKEASSYVAKGTGISFQSIDELLDHFEINPINPKMGEIGCPYSPLNTRESTLTSDRTQYIQELEELKKMNAELQHELEVGTINA